MITPFASLAIALNKSASHAGPTDAVILSPFAQLEKSAGFWSDIGDNVWNKTIKPLGQSLSSIGHGFGNAIGGARYALQNGAAAIPKAISGAFNGGLSGMMRPGGFSPLGAVSGAVSGAWSNSADARAAMNAGRTQMLNGFGQMQNGAVNTLNNWSNMPQGVGDGLYAGTKQWGGEMARSLGIMPPPPAAPQMTAQTPTPSTLGAAGPTGPMGGPGQPAPTSQPAPYAPQAPQAAPDWAAKFRQQTGSQFNPASRMDAYNMAALQNGAQTLNANQWRRQGTPSMYKGASVTPFAAAGIRKEAADFTGILAKLLRSGAGALGRSAEKARNLQMPKPPDIPIRVAGPYGSSMPSVGPDPSKLAGKWREALKNKFSAAAGKVDATGGKTRAAVNAGANTAAGAGLVAAGHSSGKNSGIDEGLSRGLDKGMEVGVDATAASDQDPGLVGRIIDVFAGRSKGVDPAALKSSLAAGKSTILSKMKSEPTKSAGASLEKSADLMGLLSKGLKTVGKGFSHSAMGARSAARAATKGQPIAAGAVQAALPGAKRMAIGKSLLSAGNRVGRTTGGLRTAVNAGVPLAAGAGLYGMGNSQGRSTGLEDGRSQGFDTGADYGIQAALSSARASAPSDPGILGRIKQVFTGLPEQGPGIDPASIQSMLAENKQSILSRLRAA